MRFHQYLSDQYSKLNQSPVYFMSDPQGLCNVYLRASCFIFFKIKVLLKLAKHNFSNDSYLSYFASKGEKKQHLSYKIERKQGILECFHRISHLKTVRVTNFTLLPDLKHIQ